MDDHHFEWPTPPPPPPPPLLDDDDCWRKGSWTSHEDKLLTDHVNLHGEGKWNSVSKLTGLRRSGKSCRLRWVNYLRPDLKRGNISPQEEAIIQELHALWGNRWSAIARSLPGRTDNEIKNYWRTHFKNSKPSKSVEKARARFLLRRQQQRRQRQRQQQKKKKKKKKEGEVVLQQQQQQQEHHGNQNDDGDNEEEEEEEEEEREMMKKRAEEASAVVLENEMAMAEMAYMLRGGGNLDGGYASDGGSSGEYVLWGGLWYLDD